MMTLSLDDHRWTEMCGGYRTPFDPRPAFRSLEEGIDVNETWEELWEELYHQGDVGEVSYAAVPHLVRIHRLRGVVDWNTFGLVTTIDLARDSSKNPPLPDWLAAGYDEAIEELARLGLSQISITTDDTAMTCILALLALWKNLRVYARILMEFTEDEMSELEAQAFGRATAGADG